MSYGGGYTHHAKHVHVYEPVTKGHTENGQCTQNLKGLAHADLTKKRFFLHAFYCFMYNFSVALISALALLKYGNLGITVVV